MVRARAFTSSVIALALFIAVPTSSELRAQNASAAGQKQVRARGLGVPFDGTPGTYNAITDVPGVEVGYKTLISGEGRTVIGKGPVRTGVTAILPRG
jgi:D-aminopeptidase